MRHFQEPQLVQPFSHPQFSHASISVSDRYYDKPTGVLLTRCDKNASAPELAHKTQKEVQ